MAKALYGYVGACDLRLTAEVARLRARVQELEDELARVHHDEHALLDVADLQVLEAEPALT